MARLHKAPSRMRATLAPGRAFVACCAALLLAACGIVAPAIPAARASEVTPSFQEVANTIEEELAALEPGEDYERGVVLVSVSADATCAEVKAALEASGAEGTQDVVAERVSDELVRVELADGASVSRAVADLQLSGVVEGAQPNYVLHVLDEQPTCLAERLGLVGVDGIDDYDDSAYARYWQLLSINADRVWANKSTTVDGMVGLGVRSDQAVGVAAIDDSFSLEHEDLAANVAGAYNADSKQAGTSANMLLASSSHGTHVAGIMAACANNALGVAGVSYNARVIPVRVSNSSGQIYTSTVVSAYEYVVDCKDTYTIRVANLSIGTSYPGFDGTEIRDDALLQAIDNAYGEGIVTVAAAGNGRRGAEVPIDFYPSDYGTVVSVIALAGGTAGATEREQAQDVSRVSNSNYNKDGEADKNIAAPGSSIYSTSLNGSYGFKTGTSMAAPVVSGVLALMFSADDGLTADEAKNLLYASAREVGDDTYTNHWSAGYGYGEVDAYAAVAAVREARAERVAATKRWVSGSQYLKVGDSYSFGVTPAEGSWTYASSNEDVLSFSGATATATATAAGTSVVSASGVVDGVAVGAAGLPVYAFGPMNCADTLEEGTATRARVAGPDGYAWTWASSDASVATVNNNGLIRAVSPGTAEITATLTLSEDTAEQLVLTRELTVVEEEDAPVHANKSEGLHAPTLTLHRLYNPQSGEHFYTASAGERDLLVAAGWRYEGVGWIAPASSGAPVYRLYNACGGDHHYTASAGERDLLVAAGWRYEGIGWYSDENKSVAVYRQYNPHALSGAHNFTVSAPERDALVCIGWRDEGIAWYGVV